MTIFGRQPVAWVAVLVAVAIAIIQTLTGQGVLGEAAAGKAIDIVNALGQVLTFVIPLVIGAIVAHQAVTPTAAPALPQGTTVKVLTPAGQPDTSTTL